MDVKSQYAWWRVSCKRNNNPLLPRNIRGSIIGKSNCGKTTVLLNLLLRSDWLDYNHLCIFVTVYINKSIRYCVKDMRAG